jgi:hypothetical protein
MAARIFYGEYDDEIVAIRLPLLPAYQWGSPFFVIDEILLIM